MYAISFLTRLGSFLVIFGSFGTLAWGLWSYMTPQKVELPWPVASKICESLIRIKSSGKTSKPFDKRLDNIKWPTAHNIESVILTLAKLREVYRGCDHVETEVPHELGLPTEFDFKVKFGSKCVGHEWYMAGTESKTTLYLYHLSWSSFQPIESFESMHQNYIVIKELNRRSVIATQNFLFGYYKSSPEKMKIWKISSIFGRQMQRVPCERLIEEFQLFQNWKIERCQDALLENHIYCLISNEWQRRTLLGKF